MRVAFIKLVGCVVGCCSAFLKALPIFTLRERELEGQVGVKCPGESSLAIGNERCT